MLTFRLEENPGDPHLDGKIDTEFLISHRMPLEDAPKGYKMFHDNQNEVTKVVLKPGLAKAA